MKNFRERTDQFFEDYASRFQQGLIGKAADLEGTVASFASCFIGASPGGVVCSANNEEFRQAISKGFEFYRRIGTQTMQMGNKEVTILDDMHALVKIRWLSEYLRKDDKLIRIDFDVIYFVQDRDEMIKIFGYITGDEQRALRENGLLDE